MTEEFAKIQSSNICRELHLPWQVADKLLLYIFSVDSDWKVKQNTWQGLRKILHD